MNFTTKDKTMNQAAKRNVTVIKLLLSFFIVILISSKAFGKISSSSYLNSDERYSPANLFDLSLNTAWVPRNDNSGIGEWLLYDFQSNTVIRDIGIYNGYQKNTMLFKDNNRAKKLEISLSDRTKKVVTLKDAMGVQWIPLNKETRSIRFKILSVYKGDKYNDTCLTEVVLSYKAIWGNINKVFNNYINKKASLADIYAVAEMDGPDGWSFFDYISIEKNIKSVKTIFDLYTYNESEKRKSFNVFVAESCREAIGEKIINYPYAILPFIDKKHQVELKFIIQEYNSLKGQYVNDVRGMKIVSNSLKNFYNKYQNDPKIKEMFKGVDLE